MARTFRQRRRMSAVSELNVTNLIDVAFTLLIIFMIATPLIHTEEQSIGVNLPLESKSVQPEIDSNQKFQIVMIDSRGKYYFGQTPVSLIDLRKHLQRLSGQENPPVIRIRADLALQWQQVVSLMDELKQAGLTKITFDTRVKE